MPRSISPRSALFQLFENSPAPVVVLEETGSIIFVNPAMSRLLGQPVASLVGRKPEFHSCDEPSSIQGSVNAICPPADVIARCPLSMPVRLPAKETVPTEIVYAYLPGPSPGKGSILGVVRSSVEGMERYSPLDQRPAVAVASPLDPLALHQRLQQLRHQLRQAYRSEALVGSSETAHRLRRQVRAAASAGLNVLVHGPSGSGREHLARTIHVTACGDEDRPLVPLDCSLLDAELLQTTIAGFLQSCAELKLEHVPVLLLLEIDRLEPSAQRELRGVLSLEQLSLQTLATSSTSLIGLPGFDPALAQRVSEFEISLPPLNERRADIPLLAQAFVEQFHRDFGKQVVGFEPEVCELLIAVDWKTNLQGLREVVVEACRTSTRPQIGSRDLPDWIRHSLDPKANVPQRPKPVPLDQHLKQLEHQYIEEALRKSKGNRSRAARLLGISRARLLRRMEALGITDGN